MRHPLLLCLPLLLSMNAAHASRTLGSIEFEPCTLAPRGAPATVEANCATVQVPENHADPDGRRIELALAWIPATTASSPDPVFMLAGGPGQSARDSYPTVAHAFRDIRRSRDILLLDQRGTGGSNPLICRGRDGEAAVLDDLFDATPDAAAQFAARCRDALSAHADLRFYSTTDAIADLDFVRRAIGAEQINLVGISYGTRVGQQYARAYPAHLRTLVLDGVAPNAQALGNEHAKNLEAALALQFARCAEEPACFERLGDPRQRLDRLTRDLRANPRPVRFRDATTGAWREETLRFEHLGGIVRMYSYLPPLAAMIPLLLAELEDGNDALVASLATMLMSQVGDAINHGMQLSVLCTEDASLLREDPADTDSVIGVEFVQFIRAQCSQWPNGERPANFFEPLVSDVPTLLLSGEFDPVTPPRYGDEVLPHLSRARHLVLPGAGHNVLPIGCTPRLVARFIDTRDPDALDASCLDTLPRMAPFSGFHGWEP